MSTPATAISLPPPHRPSEARRKELNAELSIPVVSNFFPIERYYDAASKVYASFQQAYEANQLNDAYIYAKRYCLFCMDAIPQHNYYDATRYSKLKQLHLQQSQRVILELERIVAQMDQEEELRQLYLQQAQEREQQEQIDRWQKHLANQKKSKPSHSRNSATQSPDIQASALSKLELLNSSSSNNNTNNGSIRGTSNGVGGPSIRRDPSGEPPMGVPSSRYRIVDDSDDDWGGGGGGYALPPPIPPPLLTDETSSSNGGILPPPPSYEAIRSSSRSFLGPAAGIHTPAFHLSPHSELVVHPPPPAASKFEPPKRRIPMRQLQDQYRRAYQQHTQQGRIRVSGLSTYQGRIDDSTNGCTVISALVAANHMLRSGSNTIGDDEIVHIIDRVCGPVLRKIRSKLGLGNTHALLIPSDVHDYLVDSNVLTQEVFEGAAGGNAMDPEHMGEFLKLLAVGESGKGNRSKAAATFFFREHVISIVKYLNGNTGQVSYDLIDSLPGSVNGYSGATRTECQDLESLQVLLKWYTSRKFSDSNCSYIDSHPWDDSMADFDPRVFQGFVWMIK